MDECDTAQISMLLQALASNNANMAADAAACSLSISTEQDATSPEGEADAIGLLSRRTSQACGVFAQLAEMDLKVRIKDMDAHTSVLKDRVEVRLADLRITRA